MLAPLCSARSIILHYTVLAPLYSIMQYSLHYTPLYSACSIILHYAILAPLYSIIQCLLHYTSLCNTRSIILHYTVLGHSPHYDRSLCRIPTCANATTTTTTINNNDNKGNPKGLTTILTCLCRLHLTCFSCSLHIPCILAIESLHIPYILAMERKSFRRKHTLNRDILHCLTELQRCDALAKDRRHA